MIRSVPAASKAAFDNLTSSDTNRSTVPFDRPASFQSVLDDVSSRQDTPTPSQGPAASALSSRPTRDTAAGTPTGRSARTEDKDTKDQPEALSVALNSAVLQVPADTPAPVQVAGVETAPDGASLADIGTVSPPIADAPVSTSVVAGSNQASAAVQLPTVQDVMYADTSTALGTADLSARASALAATGAVIPPGDMAGEEVSSILGQLSSSLDVPAAQGDETAAEQAASTGLADNPTAENNGPTADTNVLIGVQASQYFSSQAAQDVSVTDAQAASAAGPAAETTVADRTPRSSETPQSAVASVSLSRPVETANLARAEGSVTPSPVAHQELQQGATQAAPTADGATELKAVAGNQIAVSTAPTPNSTPSEVNAPEQPQPLAQAGPIAVDSAKPTDADALVAGTQASVVASDEAQVPAKLERSRRGDTATVAQAPATQHEGPVAPTAQADSHSASNSPGGSLSHHGVFSAGANPVRPSADEPTPAQRQWRLAQLATAKVDATVETEHGTVSVQASHAGRNVNIELSGAGAAMVDVSALGSELSDLSAQVNVSDRNRRDRDDSSKEATSDDQATPVTRTRTLSLSNLDVLA